MKMKKFISNTSIITNICRIQTNDSIMCADFCIWFIDFKQKGKSLLDNTSLSSPNEYENNDRIILE